MQYTPDHPACTAHAERTARAMAKAQEVESPITYGVLRDDVTNGDAPLKHAAIRTRIGPVLHARGVLVLRIAAGVTVRDLGAFLELLALPAQTIFDRGGIAALVAERSIAKVQVDEIAHDVTAEELEARRRRQKLAAFFKEMLRNMLARRELPSLTEHIAELLEHPAIAASILEADAAGLVEAAAGLVLMVNEEGTRSGKDLSPGVRNVLLALGPRSRDKLLLGIPSLVGEFRAALIGALDGMTGDELTRMLFPSVRKNAADLDATLYAVSVTLPHDGTRFSVLRRTALHLFDLPSDEPENADAIAALVREIPEQDSSRKEREALRAAAQRALSLRELPLGAPNATSAPFDAERPLMELVAMTTQTGTFGRFCEWLPDLALLQDTNGILGILRGLGTASEHQADAAREAARKIALAVADRVLVDLDERAITAEGAHLEKIASTVRLLAVHATSSSMAHLDASSNRKMRRLLLDALPSAGPALLPHAVARLRASSWFVVRNAVLLIARARGGPRDLAPAARHPNEKVRVEVLRALRAMTVDAITVDIAAGCLADPAEDVRQSAHALLRGELLGASGVATLERIGLDEHAREDDRLAAVQALGRCPLDDAAVALTRILQPKSLIEIGASTVRDAAAVALRQCPAPGAAAMFEQGLASSAWRVRKACERAAGRT
jgi:hypothetical protein